jgi:hypothetical protein
VFPKLSKLLNQEDALSAPCSPQAPARGAPRPAPRLAGAGGTGGMLRIGLIRHFDVTLLFAIKRSCFPVVGRQLHGWSGPVQGQAGPS